jgi:hypothetical protein
MEKRRELHLEEGWSSNMERRKDFLMKCFGGN